MVAESLIAGRQESQTRPAWVEGVTPLDQYAMRGIVKHDESQDMDRSLLQLG